VEVFRSTRQALPWPTRILLLTSDIVRSGWWMILLGAGAAFYGFRLWLRLPGRRLVWDNMLLNLPLAGRIVRGVDTARFASTLAILAGAGVPLLRALDAARATLSNSVLAGAVTRIIETVREGGTLSGALARTKVFPPVLVHLAASGETTGQLAPMLERAATNLSREVERRALALSTLLEPLLILAMGAVVLGIVLAVLMPIIEINQLVR
jgi:general secretion pathway protein F